jgi:hypothetical protein
MAAVRSNDEMAVNSELEVPPAMSDDSMQEVERPASNSLVVLDPGRKKRRLEGIEQATSSASELDSFQQSSVNFDSEKFDMVNDFKDHYSLSIPSSVVRFRCNHTATRVIPNQNHQLLLEESVNPISNQHEIIIKRMEDSSAGAVQFLRVTYTLICAFWTGKNTMYQMLVG